MKKEDIGIKEHLDQIKVYGEPKGGDLSDSGQSNGSVYDRVAELEDAIVNIFKWTGGKRVARECRRVLPDVHDRLDKQKKQNTKHGAA